MTKNADLSPLAVLAALGYTTPEKLSTPRGRALTLFNVVLRHERLAWRANGAIVELLSCGAGEYCVTVDGVQTDKGTIDATLETVQGLVTELEGVSFQPTTAARPYEQYGLWADVQKGVLVSYAMFNDGGWDEGPAAIEFVCQHMVDRVNADFGTAFTVDDFQEEVECECAG